MIRLPDILDPVKLIYWLWPGERLYSKQEDMVYATRDAVETYVVAGNKLGKDYVSAKICLTFFLAPWCYFPMSYVRQVNTWRIPAAEGVMANPHTRRVVTTSVKDEHLDVLWAEIARAVATCKLDLLGTRTKDNKPHIIMVHHEIRLFEEQFAKNPLNYLKGQVSKLGEGLAGHHAAYTLGVGDEASGLMDETYKQFQGWAKRQLFFGNPNPCANFFKTNYGQGDLLAPGYQWEQRGSILVPVYSGGKA